VISLTGSHKAKTSDIDGDGDIDIVGKNYEKDDRPRIWLNPNNEPLSLDKWQRHLIDTAHASRYIIRSGDINRDGAPDILTGTGWYKNPGKPEGDWQRFELGKELGTAQVLFDFDHDGDLDVFGQGFVWARNDGDDRFTLLKNMEGDSGFIQGAALASFMNDGAQQIVYTYKNGDGIRLLSIPSDPSGMIWTGHKIYHWDGRTKDVDVGDIDRDGDSDILFCGRDGKILQWLRNERDGSFNAMNIAGPPRKINHRCRLADINHDGKLDAVFGHKGLLIDWYEQGESLDTPWKQHVIADSSILRFDPLSMDIADMDSDGDLDIIVGEHSPKPENLEKCRLFIFENISGNGDQWKPHIVYKGDEHHQGSQVVDIDNDGDLDIISVGYKHPHVLLYENQAVNGNRDF